MFASIRKCRYFCIKREFTDLPLAFIREVRNFQHMPEQADEPLPRREREAMDILHRLGEASAAQVQEEMSGQPSYSAVRALLGLLVEKKMLKVRKVPGARHHLYQPRISQVRAKRGALGRLLDTFFGGSPSELVASLLDANERKLPKDELTRIRELVHEYEKRKKSSK